LTKVKTNVKEPLPLLPVKTPSLDKKENKTLSLAKKSKDAIKSKDQVLETLKKSKRVTEKTIEGPKLAVVLDDDRSKKPSLDSRSGVNASNSFVDKAVDKKKKKKSSKCCNRTFFNETSSLSSSSDVVVTASPKNMNKTSPKNMNKTSPTIKVLEEKVKKSVDSKKKTNPLK
jgi:hypothetical protein